MRSIQPHLPLLNAALLLLVGLALGGGTLLHHVIPHRDSDGEPDDPTVSCSICKITENNPGDFAPDPVVQTLTEVAFPSQPVPVPDTGIHRTTSLSPRAPPSSV